MLKTFLTTTALTATLAVGAYGQETGQKETTPAPATPPVVEQEPAQPLEGTAPMEGEAAAPTAGMQEGVEVDIAEVSAEELIGSDVRTKNDETIATVDDVVVSDDGKVESIVVTFGGFLGFGTNTVELTPEEVSVTRFEDETLAVYTELTPEMLEGRPEYQES